MYEPFINEGDALAYAAGAALAGKKCAVVMQSSGLTNAISPLTSLNELFGLHTLLIIGNRGVDDEPQHRIMANVLAPILKTLEIPFFDAEMPNAVAMAFEHLTQHSTAILVSDRNTLDKTALIVRKGPQAPQVWPLRSEYLRVVADCAENAVIITSTGFTSREMFCIQDRPENFYMVGSMGCLSSLASGIADYFPNRPIIAIDGDSACLMRLGALYTVTQKQPHNLCYIVLDNEANESTGGQRNSLGASRLLEVMNSMHSTDCVDSPSAMSCTLRKFLRTKSYMQIYAKIRIGSARDLPRPDRQLIYEQARRFRAAVTK